MSGAGRRVTGFDGQESGQATAVQEPRSGGGGGGAWRGPLVVGGGSSGRVPRGHVAGVLGAEEVGRGGEKVGREGHRQVRFPAPGNANLSMDDAAETQTAAAVSLSTSPPDSPSSRGERKGGAMVIKRKEIQRGLPLMGKKIILRFTENLINIQDFVTFPNKISLQKIKNIFDTC